MKKIFIIIISVFLLSSTFNIVQAQGLVKVGAVNNFTTNVGKSAGFTPDTSIGSVVAKIIQMALALLAIIFLTLMVTAGFKWMTAGGNEEEIKKAQGTIKSALIGLIIVLLAWAIVYFIFTYLPFSGNGGGMVAG